MDIKHNLKEKSNTTVDKNTAKKIIDASGYIINEDDNRLVGLNTIGKLLEFFEIDKMIEEKPKEARAVLSAMSEEV